MSEAAFIFPTAPRADAIRVLNELAESQLDQWVAAGPIYVWLVDEGSGLYLDWEPDDVASLERAVGCRPAWGVQIQYRLSRRQSMVALALSLLRLGGIAVDDFCNHAWTAEEIEADTLISDGRFGEPPVR
ncbi:hypothetical protein GA0074692_2743 [Micromonospora pallida]|uniref:Uncharacterized protein n=1 Tax=Micromonospora pallida TaxID=145854 RepID=A0A1C6SJC2_9ACTN|nr:hypothetical protein [Micromonospora pallida]SCL29533.1 hypothetical protein GA0074692_2743 [Micromonospora pallida]